MRAWVLVALMAPCAALAQDVSPLLRAVMEAKGRVCTVAPDSRHCEILTGLYIDTVQGRHPVVAPELTPEQKAAIKRVVREQYTVEKR